MWRRGEGCQGGSGYSGYGDLKCLKCTQALRRRLSRTQVQGVQRGTLSRMFILQLPQAGLAAAQRGHFQGILLVRLGVESLHPVVVVHMLRRFVHLLSFRVAMIAISFLSVHHYQCSD